MQRHLFLLAAGAISFGSSLSASFHFDDYSLFNGPYSAAASLARLWSASQTRPLTNFTFWLNFHLGGSHPFAFHAVNLVLHLSTILLLYFALQRLLPQSLAFWSALLFSVHPAQSEAIAYVFARSSLLCTLFCAASLCAWVTQKPVAAIVLFACALLSKEECVTFPLVLALLPQPPQRRFRAWPIIALMLALSLAAGLRAIWSTALTPGSSAGVTAGVSVAAYFAAQGPAILRYLQLLAVPYGFTIEPSLTLTPPYILLSWTVLLLAIAFAIWRRHKPDLWPAWFLTGLVLLIPSSSIFPAADLAADRRLYLPMLGFSTALAFGLLHLGSLLGFRRVIPATAAVVFALLSISRMQTWQTETSLWREAMQRSPTHVRPLLQLARAVPDREAFALLAKAKSLDPRNAQAAAESGRLALKTGDYPSALRNFGFALALHPNDANAINNRGAALLALKQQTAARKDFERALAIDPCLAPARANLQSLGVSALPVCSATGQPAEHQP